MRYAVLSPGKRIRPALCLAAAQAVQPTPVESQESDGVLEAACAIEMVHAFSLIHDDLPAIDNDDLRRGQPTVHVKFGEATAVLAGDSLFAQSFYAILNASAPADRLRRAAFVLARASHELVRGELQDILAEGGDGSAELLDFIHRHKTGALIAAACEIGAILGGGSDAEIQQLHEYGLAVGLAFQIADDILDEVSTRDTMGKTTGADRAKGKLTYPSQFGIDRSYTMASDLVNTGLRRLEALPGETRFLAELARFSVSRGS